MKKEKKIIDIVSCIDCPWCWLQNEVLLQFNDDSYEFVWHPYILKSDVAEKGESFRKSIDAMEDNWSDKQIEEYVNSKSMQKAAKSLGFKWVYRDTRYSVIKASIYAMYAKEQGVLKKYIKEIYRQYFQAELASDRNINNIEVLQEVATRITLNKSSVKSVLTDKKYIELFYNSMNKYKNVRSVPKFIYKNKTLSGYIPKEQFANYIKRLIMD